MVHKSKSSVQALYQICIASRLSEKRTYEGAHNGGKYTSYTRLLIEPNFHDFIYPVNVLTAYSTAA